MKGVASMLCVRSLNLVQLTRWAVIGLTISLVGQNPMPPAFNPPPAANTPAPAGAPNTPKPGAKVASTTKNIIDSSLDATGKTVMTDADVAALLDLLGDSDTDDSDSATTADTGGSVSKQQQKPKSAAVKPAGKPAPKVGVL